MSVFGSTYDEHLARIERHPTCRICRTESPTVCPHNGKCFECDRPNPYGVTDDYDDLEVEPPLDDSGPRSNGRIFL